MILIPYFEILNKTSEIRGTALGESEEINTIVATQILVDYLREKGLDVESPGETA